VGVMTDRAVSLFHRCVQIGAANKIGVMAREAKSLERRALELKLEIRLMGVVTFRAPTGGDRGVDYLPLKFCLLGVMTGVTPASPGLLTIC
jgi:hypothetical protein